MPINLKTMTVEEALNVAAEELVAKISPILGKRSLATSDLEEAKVVAKLWLAEHIEYSLKQAKAALDSTKEASQQEVTTLD